MPQQTLQQAFNNNNNNNEPYDNVSFQRQVLSLLLEIRSELQEIRKEVFYDDSDDEDYVASQSSQE